MVVRFGTKIAEILDCTNQLITVKAPTQPNLLQDTEVILEISNRYPKQHLTTECPIKFVYIVPNPFNLS